MKRFLNLVVYILTIHVSALLIAGLFRLVLFISSYHQLTSEALSDKTLPMLAFVHGVWFDNVIGCYILLLPLVVAVVCGVCNYYGKALFRFFTIFFRWMGYCSDTPANGWRRVSYRIFPEYLPVCTIRSSRNPPRIWQRQHRYVSCYNS